MSYNKKYYFLKLKENFFDSDEIKILESNPNGIYYSNLLLKLYLKSLKNDGEVKFNDAIPLSESMISTITGLSLEIVKKGLETLQDLGLITKLANGVIYMTNIQEHIGRSCSESDRKRDYRAKIETERKQPAEGYMQNNMNGTILGQCPLEIERETEIDKELDKELENRERERDRGRGTAESLSLLKDFESLSGDSSKLSLPAVKKAVEEHGKDNVWKAMVEAVNRNRTTMKYINGILKNWKKEGYPEEEIDYGTSKFNGENRSFDWKASGAEFGSCEGYERGAELGAESGLESITAFSSDNGFGAGNRAEECEWTG